MTRTARLKVGGWAAIAYPLALEVGRDALAIASGIAFIPEPVPAAPEEAPAP